MRAWALAGVRGRRGARSSPPHVLPPRGRRLREGPGRGLRLEKQKDKAERHKVDKRTTMDNHGQMEHGRVVALALEVVLGRLG